MNRRNLLALLSLAPLVPAVQPASKPAPPSRSEEFARQFSALCQAERRMAPPLLSEINGNPKAWIRRT
jgi:hypothetical protein